MLKENLLIPMFRRQTSTHTNNKMLSHFVNMQNIHMSVEVQYALSSQKEPRMPFIFSDSVALTGVKCKKYSKNQSVACLLQAAAQDTMDPRVFPSPIGPVAIALG